MFIQLLTTLIKSIKLPFPNNVNEQTLQYSLCELAGAILQNSPVLGHISRGNTSSVLGYISQYVLPALPARRRTKPVLAKRLGNQPHIRITHVYHLSTVCIFSDPKLFGFGLFVLLSGLCLGGNILKRVLFCWYPCSSSWEGWRNMR